MLSFSVAFLLGTVFGYKVNSWYRRYLQKRRDTFKKKANEIQDRIELQ